MMHRSEEETKEFERVCTLRAIELAVQEVSQCRHLQLAKAPLYVSVSKVHVLYILQARKEVMASLQVAAEAKVHI